MILKYYIKFDNYNPERIVAKNFLELMSSIDRLVTKYQKPFEWIIRDY